MGKNMKIYAFYVASQVPALEAKELLLPVFVSFK